MISCLVGLGDRFHDIEGLVVRDVTIIDEDHDILTRVFAILGCLHDTIDIRIRLDVGTLTLTLADEFFRADVVLGDGISVRIDLEVTVRVLEDKRDKVDDQRDECEENILLVAVHTKK